MPSMAWPTTVEPTGAESAGGVGVGPVVVVLLPGLAVEPQATNTPTTTPMAVRVRMSRIVRDPRRLTRLVWSRAHSLGITQRGDFVADGRADPLRQPSVSGTHRVRGQGRWVRTFRLAGWLHGRPDPAWGGRPYAAGSRPARALKHAS